MSLVSAVSDELPDDARPALMSNRSRIISATVGSTVTSLTMTPFDVIKTRLQAGDAVSAAAGWQVRPQGKAPAQAAAAAEATLPAAKRAAIRAPPARATPLSPPVLSHVPLYRARGTPPTLSARFPTPPTLLAPPTPHASLRAAVPLTGFVHAARTITQTEGLSALWAGTGAALIMGVPGQIIYMMGLDLFRRRAFETPPAWARDGPALSTAYISAVPLAGGALARTCVAVLFSPVELVRTRLQATADATLKSVLQELRNAPLRTLYTGLGPTLWRDVPFSGVYWMAYELIKRQLTGGRGMGEASRDMSVGHELGVSFISGAGSGMLAATLTNPFDVVKTRRQTSTAPSASALSLLVDIARREGIGAYLKGLTPRLAKVGPACGIMIGCYEGLGRYLE